MKKGDLYRHFKGGLYIFEKEALNTEKNEPVVVYRDRDGRYFVRPHKMWNETVVVEEQDDGVPYKTVPRFQYLCSKEEIQDVVFEMWGFDLCSI